MKKNNLPIAIKYFLRIPNVGDLANPNIVEGISSRTPVYYKKNDIPHLLAIGSIISTATPNSWIWGTGLMHPKFGIGNIDGLKIGALRGPKTLMELIKNGINIKDIPLGDPGYLLSKVLNITKSKNPTHKLGVVSHYVDRSHPKILELLKSDGVLDLNVHLNPDKFLSQMALCETVISSSLHGLIFAESLGIPNLWIKATNEIGGGEFKFQDWFETTRNPQKNVFDINKFSNINDLILRSETRESLINIDDLTSAFPPVPTHDSMLNKEWISVEECRSKPTPVFFISFNRGDMLKKSISAIKTLKTSTSIIVHDNGSSDSKTINILKFLEKDGITIYKNKPINNPDELNQVNKSIEKYFSNWCEPKRYIVSDCDIDLSEANPDTINIYDKLLNIFRKTDCIGPMLKINDIPDSYPLKNHALNRHIEQFWKEKPSIVNVDDLEVAYLNCQIDTTLALHRAGENFKRLKSGARIYSPFEARHLDWYTHGGPYAESTSKKISHWNNLEYTKKYLKEKLNHNSYYIASTNESGKCIISKIIINKKEK